MFARSLQTGAYCDTPTINGELPAANDGECVIAYYDGESYIIR